MNGQQIAKGLGLSAAMVSKLRRRGMPTTSIEAAQKWRKRHLNPAMVKGARFDASCAGATAPSAVAVTADVEPTSGVATDGSDALELVERLAEFGALLLAQGRFDQIESSLRAALRLVPKALRGSIGIALQPDDPRGPCGAAGDVQQAFRAVVPAAVWEELMRPLIDAINEDAAKANGGTDETAPDLESDADEQRFESILYAIATGELRVVPEKERDASV